MSTTTSHNTTPASSEKQVLSGPPPSPRPATTGHLGTPGTSCSDPEEAAPRPAADVPAGGLPSPSIVAHLVGRGSGGSRGGEVPAADSYDSDAGLGLLGAGSWAHEGFERRRGGGIAGLPGCRRG